MESLETAEKVQEPEEDPNVIKAANGEPFPNERSAKNVMRTKGLSAPEWYIKRVSTEFEEGYVVERRPTYKEKYYWVTFSARSNPNDPPDVSLSVNGEKLVIAREKKVVIPGRYRECADNARFIKFSQEPNKPRKMIGTIQIFPYSLLGEATEKDFMKMREEGTRAVKKHIERFGFDVTPEQVDD